MTAYKKHRQHFAEGETDEYNIIFKQRYHIESEQIIGIAGSPVSYEKTKNKFKACRNIKFSNNMASSLKAIYRNGSRKDTAVKVKTLLKESLG